ncbi:MAG: hypothetical protein ABH851_09270 [Methanobacteriota archaeon]
MTSRIIEDKGYEIDLDKSGRPTLRVNLGKEQLPKALEEAIRRGDVSTEELLKLLSESSETPFTVEGVNEKLKSARKPGLEAIEEARDLEVEVVDPKSRRTLIRATKPEGLVSLMEPLGPKGETGELDPTEPPSETRIPFNELLLPEDKVPERPTEVIEMIDDVKNFGTSQERPTSQRRVSLSPMSGTRVGDVWGQHLPDVKPILEGAHVVDLGAGSLDVWKKYPNYRGNLLREQGLGESEVSSAQTASEPPLDACKPSLQRFLEKSGIRAGYTGVDPFIQFSGDYDPYRNIADASLLARYNLTRPNNLEVAYVNADMLDFVSRMPDGESRQGKICFFLNAIDSDVINSGDSSTGGRHPYFEHLAEQIAKKLPAGDGYVFAWNSEASRYFEEVGLEPVKIYNPGSNQPPDGIWRKPSTSSLHDRGPALTPERFPPGVPGRPDSGKPPARAQEVSPHPDSGVKTAKTVEGGRKPRRVTVERGQPLGEGMEGKVEKSTVTVEGRRGKTKTIPLARKTPHEGHLTRDQRPSYPAREHALIEALKTRNRMEGLGLRIVPTTRLESLGRGRYAQLTTLLDTGVKSDIARLPRQDSLDFYADMRRQTNIATRQGFQLEPDCFFPVRDKSSGKLTAVIGDFGSIKDLSAEVNLPTQQNLIDAGLGIESIQRITTRIQNLDGMTKRILRAAVDTNPSSARNALFTYLGVKPVTDLAVEVEGVFPESPPKTLEISKNMADLVDRLVANNPNLKYNAAEGYLVNKNPLTEFDPRRMQAGLAKPLPKSIEQGFRECSRARDASAGYKRALYLGFDPKSAKDAVRHRTHPAEYCRGIVQESLSVKAVSQLSEQQVRALGELYRLTFDERSPDCYTPDITRRGGSKLQSIRLAKAGEYALKIIDPEIARQAIEHKHVFKNKATVASLKELGLSPEQALALFDLESTDPQAQGSQELKLKIRDSLYEDFGLGRPRPPPVVTPEKGFLTKPRELPKVLKHPAGRVASWSALFAVCELADTIVDHPRETLTPENLAKVGARNVGWVLAFEGGVKLSPNVFPTVMQVLAPVFAAKEGWHYGSRVSNFDISDAQLYVSGSAGLSKWAGMGAMIGSAGGPVGSAAGAGVGGGIYGVSATASAFREVKNVRLEGEKKTRFAAVDKTIQACTEGFVKPESSPDNELTQDAVKRTRQSGTALFRSRVAEENLLGEKKTGLSLGEGEAVRECLSGMRELAPQIGKIEKENAKLAPQTGLFTLGLNRELDKNLQKLQPLKEKHDRLRSRVERTLGLKDQVMDFRVLLTEEDITRLDKLDAEATTSTEELAILYKRSAGLVEYKSEKDKPVRVVSSTEDGLQSRASGADALGQLNDEFRNLRDVRDRVVEASKKASAGTVKPISGTPIGGKAVSLPGYEFRGRLFTGRGLAEDDGSSWGIQDEQSFITERLPYLDRILMYRERFAGFTGRRRLEIRAPAIYHSNTVQKMIRELDGPRIQFNTAVSENLSEGQKREWGELSEKGILNAREGERWIELTRTARENTVRTVSENLEGDEQKEWEAYATGRVKPSTERWLELLEKASKNFDKKGAVGEPGESSGKKAA